MKCPIYKVESPIVVVGSAEETQDDLDLFGCSGGSDTTLDNEMDRFSMLHQLKKDTDVIKWWASHRAEYPVLYKMAVDYLSIPATSVASERANSAAKRVFDGRENLGDNLFKAQIRGCVSRVA
ncbi:hypothetical protein ACHHYP_14798 [Achlya hypogyna]|uniref:HAT C-terminal dimerisation domain-containing protein n=1 Tax=Achlya hypogyna TaxID=1202772 RepID=A0A1V9YCE3_ACHHY|nr:hypothetical protein ACHHYP_14798 [Achlya hypogyna]